MLCRVDGNLSHLGSLWGHLGSVGAILGHFCDIPIISEVTIGPF